MKITFSDEAAQDWDGIARVFSAGLLHATVDIKAREWEDPNPPGYQNSDVEIWDGRGDIVSVESNGLTLSYDDGSGYVFVPFHGIEEVKYL